MNFTSEQVSQIAALVQQALCAELRNLSLEGIEIAILRRLLDKGPVITRPPNSNAAGDFTLDGVRYCTVASPTSSCVGCAGYDNQGLCNSLQDCQDGKDRGCHQVIFIKKG